MNNFLIIVGTRPEVIKCIPIYKELKNRADVAKVTLLVTGQHEELVEPLWQLFDVQPDVNLKLKLIKHSLPNLTSNLLFEINNFVEQHTFDCIIVQGDTSSSFVGSLVAFYNKIKLAHVEAGLRTLKKYSPFPEEINRRMISLTADYHFAPTKTAKKNLEKEHIYERVFITGNSGIDALEFMLEKVSKNKDYYFNKFADLLKSERLVLITGHRRENLGNRFDVLFETISEIAYENPSINFIFPTHLNPSVKNQVDYWLKDSPNIFIIPHLPYDEMIFLMSESYLIMSDSGGIQEESPSLGKPLMVMRDSTERPEGIEAGCNILAGETKEKIKTTFSKIVNNPKIYDTMSKVLNPYGDGQSSKRIVDILLSDKY